MEAADMMVILKPKKEWTSATTFPELANKMKHGPGSSSGYRDRFPIPCADAL